MKAAFHSVVSEHTALNCQAKWDGAILKTPDSSLVITSEHVCCEEGVQRFLEFYLKSSSSKTLVEVGSLSPCCDVTMVMNTRGQQSSDTSRNSVIL